MTNEPWIRCIAAKILNIAKNVEEGSSTDQPKMWEGTPPPDLRQWLQL